MFIAYLIFFRLTEILEVNNGLRSEISRYITSLRELENINQTIKDEHQALQLAFASLEEKLRKSQVNLCFIMLSQLITIFTSSV